MAAATAAAQPQRPPFSLDAFLRLSTPQVMRVQAPQAYTDGGLSTFIMPQTGLLSEIMVNIAVTITVAGTVTGGKWAGWPYPAPFSLIKNVSLSSNQNLQLRNMTGWGWYKWVRRRYGIDPLATATGSFSTQTNKQCGIGAMPMTPGANVAAGTYTFQISLPMPIAYNRQLLAGLLVLQNNSIQYPFSIQWGTITGGISATGGSNDMFAGLTGTGLSVTASVVTTVNAEIFMIPRNYPPDLSMFMSVNEYNYPLVAGQNIIKPAVSDLFTMFILEAVNNGLQVDPASLSNAVFSYSGNLRRYDEDIAPKAASDFWHSKVQNTDGTILYDLGIRSGLISKRDLYDAFNDTMITDLALQFNTPNNYSVTGASQVSLISEALRYVQQR